MFGFCLRRSLTEVKQISLAAPHHRKVSAPRPPLSAHSRHHTTNTINSPQEYSVLHSHFTENKRDHAKAPVKIQLSNRVTGSIPACSCMILYQRFLLISHSSCHCIVYKASEGFPTPSCHPSTMARCDRLPSLLWRNVSRTSDISPFAVRMRHASGPE